MKNKTLVRCHETSHATMSTLSLDTVVRINLPDEYRRRFEEALDFSEWVQTAKYVQMKLSTLLKFSAVTGLTVDKLSVPGNTLSLEINAIEVNNV